MVPQVRLQPVGGAQGDCGDSVQYGLQGGRTEGARLELQALTDTEHAQLCPSCDWELQGTQELGSQVLSPSPSQPSFHSLIPTGPRTLLLWSKGCSGRGAEDNSSISIYSRPPGMLVASYTRFCSSNLCNEASSSSVLLSSLPRPSMGPRHLGSSAGGWR